MQDALPARAINALHLPVASIIVGANYRKKLGDLSELKASITQRGVRHPITVRPLKDGTGYEVVTGQRRLCATAEFGLPTIPAIIREMTDEEVLEEQHVENLQREDPHPMEEAEAFGKLAATGKTVEEIAARVGKERRHVLHRLKLLDLIPKARTAFFARKFDTSIAYLLARIPDEGLQGKALAEVLQRSTGGAQVTASQVAQLIRQRFMLTLKDAPFDRTDAELVPDAGACDPCPYRTGKARDLFGDIPEKDLCTKPSCFDAKVRASWTRQAEQALALGYDVLSEEEALKLFPYGQQLDTKSPFIDLDSTYYQDPKLRTWRQLISPANMQIVLAKDTFHRAHMLVRKDDALAALEHLGHSFADRSDSPEKAHRRSQQQKAAGHARVVREVLARVSEAAAARPPDRDFWALILTAFTRGGWHDAIAHLVKRRGWRVKSVRPEETLLARLASLSDGDLRGIVMELVVGRSAYWSHSGALTQLMTMACAHYGIEVSGIAPPDGNGSDEGTEQLPSAPEVNEPTAEQTTEPPAAAGSRAAA